MNPRPSVLRPLVLALSVASCAVGGPGAELVDSTAQAVDSLQAVAAFGTNPGKLLMYTYAPQGVAAGAPVVLGSFASSPVCAAAADGAGAAADDGAPGICCPAA